MTFVGVSRLAVPRSSSSPQRAQLLSTAFLLIVASTFLGVRRTPYYGKAFYIVVGEAPATKHPRCQLKNFAIESSCHRLRRAGKPHRRATRRVTFARGSSLLWRNHDLAWQFRNRCRLTARLS